MSLLENLTLTSPLPAAVQQENPIPQESELHSKAISHLQQPRSPVSLLTHSAHVFHLDRSPLHKHGWRQAFLSSLPQDLAVLLQDPVETSRKHSEGQSVGGPNSAFCPWHIRHGRKLLWDSPVRDGAVATGPLELTGSLELFCDACSAS
ncbi:hypothetical protein P7K49_028961 [Saguinus oedipus]|uniref:Uncharacterized protein n=1 Tax=Saguinus oedipus TaxID=9490 RepID=A0ABQ9U5V3_SAGOE|nr:hypothetical protein P7K49_028961 [Saguinus oedipus]